MTINLLSTFRHRRQQQVTQYDEALNYEWVLAPEPDTELLTDVDGMILAVNDVIQHVDDHSYGRIAKIANSPHFGEEHILMALVVWFTEDGTIDVDYYAGYRLSLV